MNSPVMDYRWGFINAASKIVTLYIPIERDAYNVSVTLFVIQTAFPYPLLSHLTWSYPQKMYQFEVNKQM